MIPFLAGGFACGVGISYAVDKYVLQNHKDDDEADENEAGGILPKYVIPEPTNYTDQEFKLVIGIRTDLKFKLYDNATILGDIVIKSIINAIETQNPSLPYWYYFGQAKICVKVPSQEEMQSLSNNLDNTEIPYVTQTNENNQIIAIAIGPAPVELVDSVSRHLKLM